MDKIEDALWENYEDVCEMLNDMKTDSDQYVKILEEKDKIRKELIEIGQIRQETDIKMAQIESENHRENIRNGISIGTFAVSTLVTIGRNVYDI